MRPRHVSCHHVPIPCSIDIDVQYTKQLRLRHVCLWLFADEGDLRLIDEEQVSNWITGRLQVYFEGSWSQVCATAFDVADADVACRQLGYGSGSVVSKILSFVEREESSRTNVFPEVAIIGSGCTGTEDRLLDCALAPPDTSPEDYTVDLGRDCLNSDGTGLVVACVSAPLQGAAAGASGKACMAALCTLLFVHRCQRCVFGNYDYICALRCMWGCSILGNGFENP